MKKLFLTIAAFSALTFTAVAQGNRTTAPANTQEQLTPEQKADKEVSKAASHMNLTDAQKAKFKQFSIERITANRALRAGATTNEEKQKAKELAKVNNEKFFTNVNATLNADQQTKWAEHRKKAEAKQAVNHQD